MVQASQTQPRVRDGARPGASGLAALKLIRSGEISIELKSYEEGARAADAIARSLDGYVAASHPRASPASPRAARCRSAFRRTGSTRRFAGSRRSGASKTQQIDTVDISKEYFDLETRLRVERDAEARLRDVLRNRTAKLSDIVEAEAELTRIVGEIEQTEGERLYDDRRIAFSTIALSLAEPGVAPMPVARALGAAADPQRAARVGVPAGVVGRGPDLRRGGRASVGRGAGARVARGPADPRAALASSRGLSRGASRASDGLRVAGGRRGPGSAGTPRGAPRARRELEEAAAEARIRIAGDADDEGLRDDVAHAVLHGDVEGHFEPRADGLVNAGPHEEAAAGEVANRPRVLDPSRQNVIDHSTAERASSRGMTWRKRRTAANTDSGLERLGEDRVRAGARRRPRRRPAASTSTMGIRENAGSALSTRQRSRPVMPFMAARTISICGRSRRTMSRASVPPLAEERLAAGSLHDLAGRA